MKAYEVGAQKGIDSLRLADRDDPTAAPGQAVVKFHANSLNYRDYMVLNGWYGPGGNEHLIPLSDGAGEVVAVGDGVDSISVGDRVCVSFFSAWMDGPFGPQYFGSDLGGGADGTLTELGAFPADALVKLPDSFSYAEGACLPCAGVTAWNAIVEAGAAKDGDTVLLLGTGGVSIFGVQIAKAKGLTAIITSSSDDKLAKAKALGADHGINYKTSENWAKAVLDATGGAGANIVIETGGPGSLQGSFEASAFNGRIGMIGGLAGDAEAPLNTGPMVGKNLNVRGITVGSKKMLQNLADTMANNGLKPVIDKEFSFENAADAFRHMESQAHLGKIVITHS
jgi:NADPH:quinone reductase-like Zn-dependent oxidoreductase